MKINILFLFTILFSTSISGQIWNEKSLYRLTSREYEATLKFWQEKYDNILHIDEIGKSEGEKIYLLKITDPNVSVSNKQVALFTALHGGPERSGTTSLFRLIEWLLSDDPEAIETREKQVVLAIPIILPKSYFETDQFRNSENIDPYTGGGIKNWDLNSLTYLRPKEAPEVMAFLKVVDEYKPDIHLDLHGTGLQEYSTIQKKESEYRRFRGQIMFEVTGMAYSNSILRPWDWRITEKMITAGKNAGYPSDRAEADAQQLHWVPGNDKVNEKIWRGRPQFYTAQYSYLKYHTLTGCLEIAWEESGVERAKGLLQIGNEVWDGENRSGYPVNRVKPFLGKYITSWGRNSHELRKSRVELWNMQGLFSTGILYPEVEGRESFVVGLSQKGNQMMDSDLQELVDKLSRIEGVNLKAIKKFISSGPQIKFAYENAKKLNSQNQKIQHGLGLRIRIPYESAIIENVRLNGHKLTESLTDGYESWKGNGYLQLQINVPPTKSKDLDIAFVTCEYDPGEKRSYGWVPPKEVLDELYKR